MPRHSAAMPPSSDAADLPDPQEHRVQAHDRAAVAGELLGDVGQEADGGRRGAGEHEQAGSEDDERDEHEGAGTRLDVASNAAWLIDDASRGERDARRTTPNRMIVVRRSRSKRLPHQMMPAPKIDRDHRSPRS